MLALLFQSVGSEVFGIDIHPAARIGCGVLLDHGTGFVVGETAIIENDVSLFHEVTLGGTGKEKGGARHPIVRSGVLIGAGAKVLGPFKVGDGARIAANAVVLTEVPENATAVGIPAQIVRIDGRATHYADDVDQINVKDPVEADIVSLAQRICQLEQQLKQVKEQQVLLLAIKMKTIKLL